MSPVTTANTRTGDLLASVAEKHASSNGSVSAAVGGAASGTTGNHQPPPARKPPMHFRKASGGDFGAINPQRLGLPKRSPSLNRMLEQWVEEHGGSKPIHSILVANNGLAAVKFMRSVRQWASQTFGNPKAIAFLAMATPDDMRINAEHIALADQFVEVPGGSNNNNYANVSLIVQIAERAGVDAVWPGWGHASENPALPAALAERGIVFLGPPSGPMAALGDKIGSSILAQAAGVPTLPWSGSGVAISFADCGGDIPTEVYDQACIQDVEAAVASCRHIGYPVMLKASWGGGGKGIRKVSSDEEVRAVFRQVAGEVPGSPIFAMKLAPLSRHLEVQLLCDTSGGVTSLMSRDCSIQRRHQKIVEEGPVTAAPLEVLREMERCARALARSVSYVGAATVEFLYSPELNAYYFLELNPRLQVEHPVTEGITGVNIPSCQVMIGMGVPLHRIPAIRALYGQDPKASTPFDLETTPQKSPDCHVVAVRITAEDAADGFKPTSGRIDELHFRPTPEVWGYFSVKSGGGIHEYSDSQFGHLFARGENREGALRNLVVALRDVVVRGEIRTIVDYALDMLQSPELVGNQVHTGWLDGRIARKVVAAAPPWHLAAIAGAVVRAFEHVSSQSAEYLSFLAKGQLPPSSISLINFKDSLIIGSRKYEVGVVRRSPTAFSVTLNGSIADVTTRKMADGGFLLQVDGSSHVVHVEEEAAGTRLTLGAGTCLLANEADPSRLTSTSSGKLVRYLVASGSHVAANTPYAEVEVMKMMMPLLTPAAGVISFLKPEGAALGPGDLIGRLQLDDPNAVVKAERFTGTFPELGPPVLPSARVDHRLRAALDSAHAVLAGYQQPLDRVVPELVACLDHPALALGQWLDELAVLRNRLPAGLVARIDAITNAHEDEVAAYEEAMSAGATAAEAGGTAGAEGGSGGAPGAPVPLTLPVSLAPPEFPASLLLDILQQAGKDAPPSERSALQACLDPLTALVQKHLGGREAYARSIMHDLLERFLSVEENFKLGGPEGPSTEQEAIDKLRKAHSGNPSKVLDIVISHQGLPHKCDLLSRLMAALVMPAPAHYRSQLRRLAALAGTVPGAAELAGRAAALLEHSLLGDLRAVVARALSGLDMFAGASGAGGPDDLSSGMSPATRASLTAPPGQVASPLPPGSPERGRAPGGGVGGAQQTPGAAGVDGVLRRATVLEGLYSGLPAGLVGQSPASITPRVATAISRVATAAVESKMEMLVSVPAAVEEALASLLVDNALEPLLRVRAALTYVRRLYHPFLLQEPQLLQHPGGVMTAAWLYDEPSVANTPAASARRGALVVVPRLSALPAALDSALKPQLTALGLVGPGPGCLHIAIAGELDTLIGPGLGALGSQLNPLAEDPPSPVELSITGSSNVGEVDGAAVGAAAVRQALAGAFSSCSSSLYSLGFDILSAVVNTGSSAVPLRVGYRWCPERGDRGSEKLTVTSSGNFRRDRFLQQVEPVTATLLELRKLEPYKKLQYAPSRNRQYHMYTATERPDMRSYPMRRLFVRGLLRQLGSPALLAATYSGNAAAVAGAAMSELEPQLVSCIEELARQQQQAAGSNGEAGGTSSTADWTHLFFSVLPALPLAPGGGTPMGTLLSGLHIPLGAGAHGGAGSNTSNAAAAAARAAEYDAKVAGALRASAAGLVAKHISALRQAAVACIELRLRGPQREAAWRVVVRLPTGHEHGEEHVEVYRESLGKPAAAGAAGDNASQSATAGASPAPHAHPPAASATAQPQLVYSAALSHQAAPGSHLLRPTSPEAAAAAGPGSLHGLPVLGPYPPLEPLQQRRLAARRHNVTYCYDFPTVFETALRGIWAARAAAGEPNSSMPAGPLVDAEELVFAHSVPEGGFRESALLMNGQGAPKLARTRRPPGCNDTGMVAWVMTLRTPECPQGRQVVAIANDLTYQSGAFSPREDALFRWATELALEERLPVVYLAANSGARVGLASEVREKLRVAWVDESDPTQGFTGLYLSDEDHAALTRLAELSGKELLRAERVVSPSGEVRWMLSDVIGSEDGLGVECLSGSGAIASAYNRAFREGYTITLVSGRTVGIGAYLARLGRRCVQRVDQPIILTGYAALNKLLGRPVYTSHMQLGGPRVMGTNGVSHHVVSDDLEGVNTVLTLLSFCPPILGAGGAGSGAGGGGGAFYGAAPGLMGPGPSGGATPAHSPLVCADPTDRVISYHPGPGEKLDPRAAIAGRHRPGGGGGDWESGLFDRGSWVESQAGWARTVVTGRARLGGLPVGVIAVETTVVTRHQPADPGQPDSTELNVPQAGQVWYPDSAAKTAAAMEEFALEGLPLIILANWRGFSGGQRDLFDGVLQAGSQIVEALRTYRHPVFVYIPCNAELRGGAWVVIDACISTEGSVEMYADPSARGGVLEPEGVVEIKFRAPDLVKLMHRIDPVILAAKAEMGQASEAGGSAALAAGAAAAAAAAAGGATSPRAAAGTSPEARIKAREKALLPVYQQVACAFADMHDTPVRMLAKGVLRGILPWQHARPFLACRLKRRLMEDTLAAHVATTDPSISRQAALELVRSWHATATGHQQVGRTGTSVPGPTRGGPTSTGTSLVAALSSMTSPTQTSIELPDSVVPHTHLDQLAGDDASFLEWADSGAGRAALAAELRALRARSAAGMVAQALVTPEGRDGLLSALAAALQGGDPGLAAALRSVLAAAEGSSGVGGGVRLGA